MTRTLFPILALLLAGCRSEKLHRDFSFIEPCAHYNRLQVATFFGTNAPAKKPYGTVVPYSSDLEVKQPYERIAFMSCEGKMNEEAGILKAMLYRAADMGADGVLLHAQGVGQEEQSNHEKFDITVGGTGWMSHIGGDTYVFRAQAIRFAKSP